MALTAAPAINLSYIGQGPKSSGQLIADQTSGPKAKTLYAFGVATNGNTTTAANSAPVNFIDGVQTLGKTTILQLQSVTAPATINGVANQAIYSSVFGDNLVLVGDSVVIAGFTNSGNNGTFTVNVVSATGITVTNSSSVAETNGAATLSDTTGGTPIWVDAFISGSASDTAADLAVASAAFFPSALSNTGFTLNWSALATTARTIHFGAIIAFSS